MEFVYELSPTLKCQDMRAGRARQHIRH